MNLAQLTSMYQRRLGEFEQVTIRRLSGTGLQPAKQEATARARVTDYRPDQLVGTLQQGDKQLIILAQDLIDAQFPTPLRNQDKVMINGRQHNIEVPDGASRRYGGVTVAYEVTAKG